MSPRTASIVAWSLFALFMAMVVATEALVVFGSGTADEGFVVLLAGYALAGALIAARRPGNAIGWLLLAVAVTFGFTTLVDAYVRSETAPGRVAAAWVSTWLWYFWLTLAAVFVPLLFPNGRPLSPRWRAVIWLGVAGLTLSTVGAGLSTDRLDVESPEDIRNPLAVNGWGEQVVDIVGTAGDAIATLAFTLAAISVVLRFRRSHGVERLQLKWFSYAGLITLLGLITAMLQVLFGADDRERDTGGWLEVVGSVGWFTTLFGIVVAIPLATGIAILRHRLYDIDVVIRRTLVYAALTGTLVASYLGGVLLLQLLLSPLTEDNGLAIAGSTLAAAALFRPARARIQELVDRRFFRQKYDASQTIAGFGARLRNEVELDALSGELRGVVAETMQPAHVSLWLRRPA